MHTLTKCAIYICMVHVASSILLKYFCHIMAKLFTFECEFSSALHLHLHLFEGQREVGSAANILSYSYIYISMFKYVLYDNTYKYA